MSTTQGLVMNKVELGYNGPAICSDLDYTVSSGRLTAIIGPNGCGKSTLLKGLGRSLTPRRGSITLDGRELKSMKGKEIARRIAVLPQHPIAPESMRVRDLVARGRHPYHSMLRQWASGDGEIIDAAMADTSVDHFADKLLTELSGGQRQRAWIAMILAQQTDYVLLDEPTSFLDIAHQIDVLDLARRIVEAGRTVVVVLHDIEQAARYADRVVLMADGEITAEGAPEDVVTPERLRTVFGIDAAVGIDELTGAPRMSIRGRAT